MAPLTDEQKERFLHLCSLGVDRVEAARATGEQASTYQIYALEDEEFRKRMKEALNECWRKRRVEHDRVVSQEIRDEFLHLVRSGKQPTEAAHAVGGYYWHFSRLCNVTNRTYDPEFHHAYMEAMNEGHPAFMDRIRDMQMKAAENGEYRAVRDMVIQYLPEGEKLSAKKIEVRDGDLEALRSAALAIDQSQLSNEEVNTLISLLEKAAKKPKPPLELVSGDG